MFAIVNKQGLGKLNPIYAIENQLKKVNFKQKEIDILVDRTIDQDRFGDIKRVLAIRDSLMLEVFVELENGNLALIIYSKKNN